MKSKVDLLHGIVKDLMKVPMEHGGEHEPKGVHITMVASEKPKGEGMDDMADPDGDGIPDALDPMDQDKHMKMEKAIHSKNKGMI